METLVLATAHAEAVHAEAVQDTARRSHVEYRRIDPQHISQAMSAVLERYGLAQREESPDAVFGEEGRFSPPPSPQVGTIGAWNLSLSLSRSPTP